MPDEKTPASPHEPAEPVRITDKREQRRLEAELAREQREAELARAKSDHPTASPLEDDTVLETVDESMVRVDRIQELREKWQNDGQLTDDEQAELMRLQGEQEEVEKAAAGDGVQARTAFVIIMGHDGTAVASHDLNQMIYIDHEATTDDMYAGSALVLRDIEAAITSRHVVFGLNVSAQAMQEKAMAVRQAQMMTGQSPGRRRRP